MTTLEAHIFRALTAYKVERGMPAQAAASWAQANLQPALAKWKAAGGTHRIDADSADAAFDALKEWAQSI